MLQRTRSPYCLLLGLLLLLVSVAPTASGQAQQPADVDANLEPAPLSAFTGTYARFPGAPRTLSIRASETGLQIQDSGGGGGLLRRSAEDSATFLLGGQSLRFLSADEVTEHTYIGFDLTQGNSAVRFSRTSILEAQYRAQAGRPSEHAVSDAVLMNDVDSLRKLIAAGADLDQLDTRTERAGRNGRRPLNWAALSDRSELIAMLLDGGADIHLTNRSGYTALHHAAEAGAVDAATLLLERGADPSVKTARGQTPADIALLRGRQDVHTVLLTAASARCEGQAENCAAPTLEAAGYSVPTDLEDGLQTASLTSVGASTEPIARLLQKLNEGEFNQVDSLLILKDGKLVVEQYYGSWSVDRAHMMQSVSKSITALLFGSALHQNRLETLDLPIVEFLPEHAHLLSGDKADITIEDLLTMSAGFDWNEADPAYGQPGNIRSAEVLSQDPVEFTLSQDFVSEPGEVFTYSGGYVTVAGVILEQLYETETVLDAVRASSLAALDFEELAWLPQGGGATNTAGGVLMRPRDLMKIGQLMLDGGLWQGQRLLSEEFVEASLRQQVPTLMSWPDYGYFWWGRELATADATYAIDAARGWGGQELILVRDLDLAIVMTATNYQTPTPLEGLLITSIIPAFE